VSSERSKEEGFIGWNSSNTFQNNFNWSVTKNADNTWTYDYQFTPKSIGRGAAFLSLEIGGNPTLTGTSTVVTNTYR